MDPAFGQIGSDGDGLGPKQPELFDIHVMLFAGEPAQTVAALEERFSIDRDAAERLIEDVPVVVKRAAEPDVAAEMVDVLGALGAQVVLLPAASAVPAETDLLELKVPSLPPPRLPSKPAARAQPATGGWGGLERVERPARRAETADLIARAPLAELDLGGGDEAASTRDEGASLPPAEDEQLVIAPLFEPDAGRAAAAARPRLEAPATRADHGESIPPALLGGSDDDDSDEPPAAAMPLDLGLGAVPPLPALGALPNTRGAAGPPPPPPVATGATRALPAPPPPRVAPPKVASGLVATAAKSAYEQTLEGSSSALPMLSTVQPAERPTAQRAGQGDGYWSARRAATGEAPEAKPAAADPAGAALPARPNARMRNVEVAPAATAKSVGRPILEILAGAAVFAFFAQQDNSILFGNASPLAIVLHGFALYGIGMGIWEIRS